MTNCPYCAGEIPSTDFAVRTPGDSHFHFPCSDKALDEWVKLREENAQLRELNEKLSDDLVKIIEKCAPEHEELQGYKEENDLQRHSIQQLSAQVAELRGAIITLNDCNRYYLGNAVTGYYVPVGIMNKLNNLLSHANPGTDLLDKMAKLEAVAAAAKEVDSAIFAPSYQSLGHQRVKILEAGEKLTDALAALEAGGQT